METPNISLWNNPFSAICLKFVMERRLEIENFNNIHENIDIAVLTMI